MKNEENKAEEYIFVCCFGIQIYGTLFIVVRYRFMYIKMGSGSKVEK